MRKALILLLAMVALNIIFMFFGTPRLLAQDCQRGKPCLEDPLHLSPEQPVADLVGRIIKAVLGIVGSLALAVFVYGGLVWMFSAGNQDKVAKGKAILSWAAIGLAVIFFAYAIVSFILRALEGRGG
ncbi:hypothetical protein D6821_01795 [Candidatus Parcubacteria bacterium]|nr:MAG: hypothetical protein D6821_01795 [Candidatus Parcubacteria bacterium]